MTRLKASRTTTGENMLKNLRSALMGTFFFLGAAGVAHAGPMDGVWMGEYVCAQGKTTLALTITEAPTGGADAVF